MKDGKQGRGLLLWLRQSLVYIYIHLCINVRLLRLYNESRWLLNRYACSQKRARNVYILCASSLYTISTHIYQTTVYNIILVAKFDLLTRWCHSDFTNAAHFYRKSFFNTVTRAHQHDYISMKKKKSSSLANTSRPFFQTPIIVHRVI